jgi:pimeloyl-ACP methyl ester carboxylesterase
MRDDDEAARAYTGTWCGHGDIRYADLPGGGRVRYLIAGTGPPLVLLHTVRTQLDHFQFVLPRLADSFTVCAIDFPGMGWSRIVPGARYDEPVLRAAITTVINNLALGGVTLAGESMGGTVSLTVAADLGDRVRRVIAVNAYDFPGGIMRANLLARALVGASRVPAAGGVVTRLENRQILAGIMRGGLHDPSHLPGDYLDELRRVGRRPGYPGVSRAIFGNLPSLIAARKRYRGVKALVTLVYGDSDWSRPSDRQANLALVPGAQSVTLRHTGHFAALESSEEVARILLGDGR